MDVYLWLGPTVWVYFCVYCRTSSGYFVSDFVTMSEPVRPTQQLMNMEQGLPHMRSSLFGAAQEKHGAITNSIY